MADVTVRRTEEFEPTYGGAMLKVRAGLGVTSFGIQLLRLPPNEERYPEHDHTTSGQEEVYIALDGEATLTAAGEQHLLEPGVYARVGPSETRTVVTGESSATILVLGGTPGEAFTVTQWTEDGEPDPFAASP